MRPKFLFSLCIAGIIILLGSFSAFASMYTYSFYNITNTIPANVEIGKAQLSVDVTDIGVASNQVLFTFWNKGDDSCTISEIYFDDGSLLGIAELIDKNSGGDPGVDFDEGANPPNLPNWDNAVPPFIATASFSSQANNPAPQKGVDPGEYLGIIFNLQTGRNFDDVINDLSTGDLRIGLHVTNFELGESESFINIVPIPATVWIFGAGILGLFGIRRKLSRHIVP